MHSSHLRSHTVCAQVRVRAQDGWNRMSSDEHESSIKHKRMHTHTYPGQFHGVPSRHPEIGHAEDCLDTFLHAVLLFFSWNYFETFSFQALQFSRTLAHARARSRTLAQPGKHTPFLFGAPSRSPERWIDTFDRWIHILCIKGGGAWAPFACEICTPVIFVVLWTTYRHQQLE